MAPILGFTMKLAKEGQGKPRRRATYGAQSGGRGYCGGCCYTMGFDARRQMCSLTLGPKGVLQHHVSICVSTSSVQQLATEQPIAVELGMSCGTSITACTWLICFGGILPVTTFSLTTRDFRRTSPFLDCVNMWLTMDSLVPAMPNLHALLSFWMPTVILQPALAMLVGKVTVAWDTPCPQQRKAVGDTASIKLCWELTYLDGSVTLRKQLEQGSVPGRAIAAISLVVAIYVDSTYLILAWGVMRLPGRSPGIFIAKGKEQKPILSPLGNSPSSQRLWKMTWWLEKLWERSSSSSPWEEGSFLQNSKHSSLRNSSWQGRCPLATTLTVPSASQPQSCMGWAIFTQILTVLSVLLLLPIEIIMLNIYVALQWIISMTL